jgi:hypothetical protein
VRLKSGNTPISGNQHGYIREVNRQGETVWEIEVTPDKKVVWALRDWTTLGPASSTQLLDQSGAAEKGELHRD